MNTLPSRCPLCGGEIAVTRLYCRDCDTTFDGRFAFSPFSQLSQDQLDFVELFVRCEGRINRLEEELKLSYPTIRNRLQEVIRAMGYEPGGVEEQPARITDQERLRILEDLDRGVINAETAMKMLQEG